MFYRCVHRSQGFPSGSSCVEGPRLGECPGSLHIHQAHFRFWSLSDTATLPTPLAHPITRRSMNGFSTLSPHVSITRASVSPG